MSEPQGGGVKTLAIRLPDEQHTRLVLIAQLDGITLTDAIRQAVEEFIERKRTNGDLAARAAEALEQIERETAARKAAIETLLGSVGAPEPTTGSRPRKSSDPTT